MKKNDFITKDPTEWPIGDSGLFFVSNVFDDNFYVDQIEPVAGSLYAISLYGVSRNDMTILDLDDQKFFPGITKKMNDSLYAILDLPSLEVGWPAFDTITIKNVITKKRQFIEAQAPMNEGIKEEGGLFIFEGTLLGEDEDSPYEEIARWRIFVDKEGKIIYKGFCWVYQITDSELLVTRSRTSKKQKKIILPS